PSAHPGAPVLSGACAAASELFVVGTARDQTAGTVLLGRRIQFFIVRRRVGSLGRRVFGGRVFGRIRCGDRIGTRKTQLQSKILEFLQLGQRRQIVEFLQAEIIEK